MATNVLRASPLRKVLPPSPKEKAAKVAAPSELEYAMFWIQEYDAQITWANDQYMVQRRRFKEQSKWLLRRNPRAAYHAVSTLESIPEDLCVDFEERRWDPPQELVRSSTAVRRLVLQPRN